MQIRDLNELETQLNEIGARLSIVNSLSKILIEAVYEKYDENPQDIQNLLDVLNQKIFELKKEFSKMQENLV